MKEKYELDLKRGKRMATLIRPEVSKKNKYWVDKHRHYELKHFCLQYPMWKKMYTAVTEIGASSISSTSSGTRVSDLTAKCAIRRAFYSYRIKMVEQVAKDTDEYLYLYILKGVTEGLSYTYLKTKLNIPCGRDTYYDRYRKFFWLLNKTRDNFDER